MPERTVSIGSPLGLHARPATLFVKAVNETGLPITISREGHEPVDARSVLAVMTMGAEHGQEVTLRCEDLEGAEQALDTLVDLLASDPDATQQ